MSDPHRSTGRWSGLGAIVFLLSLGAIALYVQRRTISDEREAIARRVAVAPVQAETEAARPLPWQDRLDLRAAEIVPIHAPSEPSAPDKRATSQGATPPTSGRATSAASPAAKPPTGKPEATARANTKPAGMEDGERYVQSLSDGHRILLTLDPTLQEGVSTIFRTREVPYAGAVVLDLRDNAVLAFSAHSAMDPEVDAVEILTTAWAPAASVFKLVTATALLDRNLATPDTKMCFHGGLHGIENEALKDQPSLDTQCETLSSAVAHSYNLVLAKLALQHLDRDALHGTAQNLLFDTDIAFDYPVERSPAHIPEEPNERAKVAAGFWNVDLSPLHAAILASVYGRGGTYEPPHLIAQVIGPDGSDLTPERPAPRRILNKTVAEEISRMMVATTTVGTGRASFTDDHGHPLVPGITVAGKTGSLTGRRPPALNYNWFVGFAPAEKPEIAFAVVLANEPKWKIKAHYVGRRIVQLYVERRQAITRLRDARVDKSGVVVLGRDDAGTLVAKSSSPGSSRDRAGTAAVPGPSEGEALPPVPGPVPPHQPGQP